MRDHRITDHPILDKNNEKVISYFNVELPERGIPSWNQPLIMRESMEYCCLVFTIVNSVAYFYLSAYPEIGFKNRVEFGPSLQTGNGALKNTQESIQAYYSDMGIIAEIEQPDEGGRFYRNICCYTLAYMKNVPKTFIRENGQWLTAGEIEQLSERNVKQ